jgi:HAD superfamily hydrolase (TIGR01450 family)
LEAAGLVIADRPEVADYVIAAFDRTLTYAKLCFAFQAIRRGAHLIATNADRACPTEDGEIPDAAAVIGALEATTGKRCEWVAGKPSPTMLQAVLDRMALQADQCVMVGDRLETDIKMGTAAGMTTVLVLTGVTTRETARASDIRPDYTLDSIAQLLHS